MTRRISILLVLLSGCFSPGYDFLPPIDSLHTDHGEAPVNDPMPPGDGDGDGDGEPEPPLPVTLTSEVYFNNFDGTEIAASGVGPTVGGPLNLVGVQGYSNYGFSGRFLRNANTSSTPTSLTLTGLPPHESINVQCLVAIIDSWDGDGDADDDLLTIEVDGVEVFNEAMDIYQDSPTMLAYEEDLGFTDDDENPDWFWDSAYNLGLAPQLQNIPHTSPIVVISIRAHGPDWDGGPDESFAIENLRVHITHTE